MKFSNAGSSIKIFSMLIGDIDVCHFTFRVTDSGRGVTEAQAERIFSPYYSCNPDWSQGEGDEQAFGLGLNLCRNIIRSFGGELSLVPNPSGNKQGATFQI